LTPNDLISKALRAVASAELLLNAGDVEGACNRAYYGMFDAARFALFLIGETDEPTVTKTHSGLISAFSLQPSACTWSKQVVCLLNSERH